MTLETSGLKGFFLSLSVFSALFFSGCEAPPSEPLRVATNLWPGYEPLYLARATGGFKEGTVELVEFPNTTEVIRAYRNGVVDGAACTLDEALLLARYHNDFSILLVMDYSNGADAILARPPADSLQALRGRRVGFENTALGAFFLSRALEVAGIAPGEVTLVPVVVDEQEHAYERERVDAVVTFEPVRTMLLKKGAVQIFDSSQIPGEIVDVLIVRKTFIQSHAASVESLLAGWFAALDHMKKSPGDAMKLLSARQGITPEETAASYDGLLLPGLAENRRALYGAQTLKATVEKLQKTMVESGLLDRPIPASSLFPSPETAALYHE